MTWGRIAVAGVDHFFVERDRTVCGRQGPRIAPRLKAERRCKTCWENRPASPGFVVELYSSHVVLRAKGRPAEPLPEP